MSAKQTGQPAAIDTDALADEIVATVVAWAGGDDARLSYAIGLLARMPLLAGEPVTA